mmetsp:Transcript_57579/g.187046  ORF Transcript_57579/g.187046 Transcript_57579/m.187046 type:complete len:248 (+) Transcript_57579:451-1194(+)
MLLDLAFPLLQLSVLPPARQWQRPLRPNAGRRPCCPNTGRRRRRRRSSPGPQLPSPLCGRRPSRSQRRWPTATPCRDDRSPRHEDRLATPISAHLFWGGRRPRICGRALNNRSHRRGPTATPHREDRSPRREDRLATPISAHLLRGGRRPRICGRAPNNRSRRRWQKVHCGDEQPQQTRQEHSPHERPTNSDNDPSCVTEALPHVPPQSRAVALSVAQPVACATAADPPPRVRHRPCRWQARRHMGF